MGGLQSYKYPIQICIVQNNTRDAESFKQNGARCCKALCSFAELEPEYNAGKAFDCFLYLLVSSRKLALCVSLAVLCYSGEGQCVRALSGSQTEQA